MSRDPALDAFTRLSHSSSKIRLAAAETLLKYFSSLQKEDNEEQVTTLGRRLVRGLACSKDSARKGYYLAFAGYLKIFSKLSLPTILSLAEKELKLSTASSKGEEGDIWLGRVLFFGALVRSERLKKFTKDVFTEVLTNLLEGSTKKSYLPSITAPFLVHIFNASNEDQFSKVLWPVLKESLAKQWTEQTQHSLFLLIHIYKKFKGVKKTELKSLLGVQLLGCQNWSQLSRLILEGPHPVGPLLAEHLPHSEAAKFWTEHIQTALISSSRSKDTAALDLLKSLIQEAEDKTLVGLLNPSAIGLLKKSLQNAELRTQAGGTMETLVSKVKTCSDKVRASVLEALTTEDFCFDQTTKCGLVRAVVASLEAEGLHLALELCTKTVSDDKKKNRDKTGAMQMIATLAVSQAIKAEDRQAATVFLLEQAFCQGAAASVLSQAAKTNFARCQKNAPVDVLRGVLGHVDKLTKKKNLLKMDKIAGDAWKKMVAQVANLETSKGKVEAVLTQLMVHLGLQLLTDPVPAVEALDELHECCERVIGGKQDKHWVEVVVELLLSLLANTSSALRLTVRKVFSALCPIINQQALDSLVEACTGQDNPLVPNDHESDESGEDEEVEDEDDDEENGDDGSEEENEEEDDDDDEEMEDLDDMQDTHTDRIRAAVRAALGTGGELSDTESIDIDEMTEEEGLRLDEALSQAFKSARKGLSKKESQEKQQEVHFRLRVLDLLEVYISSGHSLRLTLNLADPLLCLLERCLKDQPLRPLESRLRHIISNFNTLRRFKDSSGVTEEDLVQCLSAILGHSQRTQAVFLAVASEAAAVAAFLGRAAQTIKCTGALATAFEDAIQEFLTKRDCVLPAAFFTPLLKTSWPGNMKIWKLLIDSAFGDNEKIRPFRRPQALSFLQELATNQQLKASNAATSTKLMDTLVSKAAVALTTSQSQRFERQLLNMLVHIVSKLNATQKETLAEAVREHAPRATSAGKETKQAFRKLANIFKIPINEVKQSDSDEKEEVVVNGTAVNGIAKTKAKKKEKKKAKKRNAKEGKAAKLAAKRLRLEAASDGLDKVSFTNVQLDNIDD